jgi:hypothetical protein
MGLDSYYIKFIFTVATASDNKVTVTRTNSNLSTKNCTIANRGIRRAIINFVYNKKLDNVSILSTSKTNYRINKANYYTNKSNF